MGRGSSFAHADPDICWLDDRKLSRIKLVKFIDQYFRDKKQKVSLHFDGHLTDAIPSSSSKIIYSDNKTADSIIKNEIDRSTKPKTIAVISSDHSVQNYAKVNGCTIIKSEEFAKLLKSKKDKHSEEEISKSIDNDEIKKMFGVDL